MSSHYIFVNFPHLKIRNFNSTSETSNCASCRNNNMKFCANCVYSCGNDKLKDNFNPKGKVLVMRGQMIKRADYYDKTVTDLLLWNGELKEDVIDIKQYRQW